MNSSTNVTFKRWNTKIENERIEHKLFDLMNVSLNETRANDVNKYFKRSIKSEIKKLCNHIKRKRTFLLWFEPVFETFNVSIFMLLNEILLQKRWIILRNHIIKFLTTISFSVMNQISYSCKTTFSFILREKCINDSMKMTLLLWNDFRTI